MTNWPSIQEYKNFDAKFYDNSTHGNLIDSADCHIGTGIKDNLKNINTWRDLTNPGVPTSESKIVRCVIKKDFEENYKKLDRENLANQELVRPKVQESEEEQTVVDKTRLQNHLKWKKQKEEEYLQKKEAEKMERQRKKEEEARMEKIKKQKEKEREQKIREWEEQKAREKEEKKREKLVMRVLQEELKEGTPTVDKEKLIEEWVKLKNKQKQIEAEKKSEFMKKEQENRELRQNLAELSYRQWKERIKGRMMTLPKNGYQIFGPKPVPVVKEDWNHNFTTNTPRDHFMSLRNTKSNLTNSLTFNPPVRELDNLSKDILYLEELQNRGSRFLKMAKSGFDLSQGSKTRRKIQNKMPLKELQMGTIDLKRVKPNFLAEKGEKIPSGYGTDESNIKSSLNLFLPEYGPDIVNKCHNDLSPLMYLPLDKEYNRKCCSQTSGIKSSKIFEFSNGKPEKKKIDLYINLANSAVEKKPAKAEEKPKNISSKTSNINNHKTKNETVPKDVVNEGNRKFSRREKSCSSSRIYPKMTTGVGLTDEEKYFSKGKSFGRNSTRTSTPGPDKTFRRSRSYDKNVKKMSGAWEQSKECGSSKSLTKNNRHNEEDYKKAGLSGSKHSVNLKRKNRRKFKPGTPVAGNNDKEKPETEKKPKKKLKKKSNALSRSFSFSDSPYFVKKSKAVDKIGVRKSAKERDAKSDVARKSRQLSATKI